MIKRYNRWAMPSEVCDSKGEFVKFTDHQEEMKAAIKEVSLYADKCGRLEAENDRLRKVVELIKPAVQTNLAKWSHKDEQVLLDLFQKAEEVLSGQ